MSQNASLNMFVVGVEDGSFQKGVTRKALLAAVLLRGFKIESVKVTRITVDGLDATRKLVEILSEWKFDLVLLAGVSFAGFNVIDPTTIYDRFGKPVIIFAKTKPHNKEVKRALQRHFEDWEMRWKVFNKSRPFYRVAVLSDEPPIYVEPVGAGFEWTRSLLKKLSACGRTPEPIRVARLVARGLS